MAGRADGLTNHRRVIRAGLVYLAVSMGLVAVMILVAPRGFYDDFPAGSSSWVSVLPPFNEHLLRDYGAAGLGLTALAVMAAVWLDQRLVQAATVAIFLGTIPHAIYHSTTTGSLSTADNIASVGGLYIQALLPLALLFLASGSRQDPTGASQPQTVPGGPDTA